MLDYIFFTWLGTRGELSSSGWDSPEEHLRSVVASIRLAQKFGARRIVLQLDEEGLRQLGPIVPELRGFGVSVERITIHDHWLWSVRKMLAVASAFSSVPEDATVAHMDLDFFLLAPLPAMRGKVLRVQCLESVWEHYAENHAMYGIGSLMPFCAGFLGTSMPREVSRKLRARIAAVWSLLPSDSSTGSTMNYYAEQGDVRAICPEDAHIETLGPRNTMNTVDWVHLIRRNRGCALLREHIRVGIEDSWRAVLRSVPAYIERMTTPEFWSYVRAFQGIVVGVGPDSVDALEACDVYAHPCAFRRFLAQAYFGVGRREWAGLDYSRTVPQTTAGFSDRTLFIVESPAFTYSALQLESILHDLRRLGASTEKEVFLAVTFCRSAAPVPLDSDVTFEPRNLLAQEWIAGRRSPLAGLKPIELFWSDADRGVAVLAL